MWPDLRQADTRRVESNAGKRSAGGQPRGPSVGRKVRCVCSGWLQAESGESNTGSWGRRADWVMLGIRAHPIRRGGWQPRLGQIHPTPRYRSTDNAGISWDADRPGTYWIGRTARWHLSGVRPRRAPLPTIQAPNRWTAINSEISRFQNRLSCILRCVYIAGHF